MFRVLTEDAQYHFNVFWTFLGEGYDVDSGVFSAPVEGVYMVSVWIFPRQTPPNSTYFYVKHNGKVVCGAIGRNVSGTVHSQVRNDEI